MSDTDKRRQSVSHLMMDRRSTDQPYDKLMESVAEIKEDQKALREELRANSQLTKENSEKTAEIISLFSAAKGAFTVLGWIGTGIKWAGSIAAGSVALWALITHGNIPPK